MNTKKQELFFHTPQNIAHLVATVNLIWPHLKGVCISFSRKSPIAVSSNILLSYVDFMQRISRKFSHKVKNVNVNFYITFLHKVWNSHTVKMGIWVHTPIYSQIHIRSSILTKYIRIYSNLKLFTLQEEHRRSAHYYFILF